MAKKKISIGRNEDCDVVISEKSVSREHAEILKEKGVLSVRDLGSRNATIIIRTKGQITVEGQAVELKPKDQLFFGHAGPFQLSDLLSGFEQKVIIRQKKLKLDDEEDEQAQTNIQAKNGTSNTITKRVKPARYRCPSCGSIVSNSDASCTSCETNL